MKHIIEHSKTKREIDDQLMSCKQATEIQIETQKLKKVTLHTVFVFLAMFLNGQSVLNSMISLKP